MEHGISTAGHVHWSLSRYLHDVDAADEMVVTMMSNMSVAFHFLPENSNQTSLN